MKLFKRILEKMLVMMAWSQVTILFIFSLWSVQGEYVMALIALVIMLFLLIDDCNKHGVKRMFTMTTHEALGRNYYWYRFATLVVSCIVNIGVYVDLYFRK